MANVEQTAISLGPSELEGLIRRVVREELGRLVAAVPGSVLDDRRHEGPEDPEGDRSLREEALAVMRAHGNDPGAWADWEDFERELDEAEAAGHKEVPA